LPVLACPTDLPMFKLKDWPVDAGFAEKLARHNDDFLDMLNRWGAAG
jgi:hypothetical protein